MAITASNVAAGSFQGSAQAQGAIPRLFAPWLQSLASPTLTSRNSTLLGCHQSSTDTPIASSSRPISKQKVSTRRASVSTRGSSAAVPQKNRYTVAGDKPIKMPTHLRRQGAMRFIGPTNTLRREDSFIFVDHGSHFTMVKPAYARAHYQRTPDDIVSIAGYHSFAPVNVKHDAEVKKLASLLRGVPVPVPVASEDTAVSKGAKRVRFDEPEDDEPQTPRKRARVTPPPGL